jgi:hypothetical protein
MSANNWHASGRRRQRARKSAIGTESSVSADSDFATLLALQEAQSREWLRFFVRPPIARTADSETGTKVTGLDPMMLSRR